MPRPAMTRSLRFSIVLALGLAVMSAWVPLSAYAQTSGVIESLPLPDLDPEAVTPASPTMPVTPDAPAPAPTAPVAPASPAPPPATPVPAPSTPVTPANPLPMGAIQLPETPFPEVPPGPSIAPPISPTEQPDSFSMVSKPSLVMRGQSTWEDGFKSLRAAFDQLGAAARSADMIVTGHPITIFISSTDFDFSFDAMLPIEKVPSQLPANFPTNMHIGVTPSGHAIRIVHQAPYNDIDGTYERITAYLDTKEIDVRDTLIEEYIALGADDTDPSTTINIIILPKN